jgi:hypothetical protein
MHAEDTLRLMQELIDGQRKKLFSSAQRIVPHITPDDILQPNDFPQLEFHPHFRYEEGILDGLQVAYAALLAQMKEI